MRDMHKIAQRLFIVCIAFGLLLVVYAPTFALVSVLHKSALRLSMADMVPIIILISATLALGIMAALGAWERLTRADYGFAWPAWRFVVFAIVIALPLSFILNAVLSYTHEPGPLAGASITPILIWFYFGLGSPVQEELIFRGLIQSVLARHLSATIGNATRAGVVAMAGAAVLFGLVHLAVGPWTAVAALVLGLLAGEMRRRSGSLVPAILIHFIFNLPGLLAVVR